MITTTPTRQIAEPAISNRHRGRDHQCARARQHEQHECPVEPVAEAAVPGHHRDSPPVKCEEVWLLDESHLRLEGGDERHQSDDSRVATGSANAVQATIAPTNRAVANTS